MELSVSLLDVFLCRLEEVLRKTCFIRPVISSQTHVPWAASPLLTSRQTSLLQVPVCPFSCAENLWHFALAETLKLKILLLFLS